MTLEAGAKLAHYEITAPLGAGGMGEVYRARDTKLGREVAIKVLPEDFVADGERLARFDREARVLASLNHPHIASIYGFEDAENVKFLVMELAEGETLADRLTKGAVPIDEAIGIARQIAEALEAAHEKGIIHRDLKPANVVVDENGNAKVLDFGLAKALDVDEGGDSDITNSPTMVRAATHAGVILGTAAYMSPEQARGKKVDKRADIWSFGVVLWEMLTGARMFLGETVSDTLAFVLTAEVDLDRLPSGTPQSVRQLVRRCLVRDPRKRLRDIGEARLTLEEPSSSVADLPPPVRPGRASFVPWIAAALFLVGWIGTVMLRREEPPRVIKTELSPPEDMEFRLDAAGPGMGILSPDGTQIVFGARKESEERMLFVKDLGRVGTHPLEGTEDGAYPFWSPDSKSIGFVNRTAGQLRSVERAGGPPVTICAAPNAKGGSWNSHGVIVFAPDADAGIFRVPAAGGEPVSLTTVDRAKHNSHRHPRFLPDETHFLFFARGITASQSEVMVGSLDGGEPVSVVRSPGQAEYANGHLLFLREQTLMAQPFDPDSFSLTGEPSPVAREVALVTAASFATFSTSHDGTLAYMTGEVTMNLVVEVRDRSGALISTLSSPAAYRQAMISPDGAFAVARAYEETGAADLWTFEISRNLRSRLTSGPEDDRFPIWHPDGQRVIYVSSVDGRDVILMKTVGGTESAEIVYETDSRVIPTGVSPDGRFLLLTKILSGSDMWVLNLESGEESPIRQSEFGEGNAEFSPDGQWIVYQSVESGRPEVYVMSFPDKGRRWQVSTEGGLFPTWTSHGEEIIFQSGTGFGQLMAASVSTASGTFVVTGLTRLFDVAPAEQGGMKWSVTPDGKTFLTIPRSLSRTDREMKLTFNWPEELKRK